MSTQNQDNSWTPVQVREKLASFIDQKKLSKVELAHSIGVSDQNIRDWLKSGAMPATALMNLFQAYSDALDFFRSGAPLKENFMVAEFHLGYHVSKGKELIALAQEFVQEAGEDDEIAMGLLLDNVKGFLEMIRKRKGTAGALSSPDPDPERQPRPRHKDER